jgi:hypothetical protein
MIKKTRIRKFNFFRGIGNIYFFKRHSNLFLVFFDSRKKHIVTLTSGFCKLGRTKKQKVAALNMEGLVKVLKVYLDKYKIKYLKLHIRQRLAFHLYNLRKLLRLYNYLIVSSKFLLYQSHTKKRGRTVRRI